MSRGQAISLLIAIVLGLGALMLNVLAFGQGGSGKLKVVFLDVGQGDAIFIETPGGRQLLIDGGRDTKVLSELARVMKPWDRSLDMVMATHPDSDHIGGLIEVLNRFQVAAIMEPDPNEVRAEDKQGAALAFEIAQRSEGTTNLISRSGQQYILDDGDEYPGDEVVLTVLWPTTDLGEEVESNTLSIVARLDYGETSWLFTGDAPISTEKYLLSSGADSAWLDVDVLKLGHHGSRTSSAKEFIAATSPTYAVIQVGADNSYGHPHQEVLDTSAQFPDITIFRNDIDGLIRMQSDGRSITVY